MKEKLLNQHNYLITLRIVEILSRLGREINDIDNIL